MTEFKLSKNFKYQQGAAVMLFSAILLLGITTTMIFSASSSVIEQKVTGNQVRAKQARQAANSGLTSAMVSINKSAVSASDTGTLPTTIIQKLGEYTLSYETLTAGDPNKILVTVSAKSEDQSGFRSMQQVYKFMPFMNTTPPATLISEGDVTLSDPTVVLDNKSTTNSDATIWCGRTMKKRGPSGTSPAATTAKTVSQFPPGQQKKRIRSNVNNTANPLPSGNALFESFFTNKKQNIKKLATVVTCPPSGCNTSDVDGLSGLVWIDGNLNMNAATTQGVGQYDNLASIDNPVVLIINGNLKMNHSGAQINGLVYVSQNWDNSNGNGGKIKGSVIVEGNATASGSLTLKYNNEILSSITNNIGMYLPIPGTWKEI